MVSSLTLFEETKFPISSIETRVFFVVAVSLGATLLVNTLVFILDAWLASPAAEVLNFEKSTENIGFDAPNLEGGNSLTLGIEGVMLPIGFRIAGTDSFVADSSSCFLTAKDLALLLAKSLERKLGLRVVRFSVCTFGSTFILLSATCFTFLEVKTGFIFSRRRV